MTDFGFESKSFEDAIILVTKDGTVMYRYLLVSKLIPDFAPAGLLWAGLIDEDGKCVYSNTYTFTKDGVDVIYEVEIGGFDGEPKENYCIELIYENPDDPKHTIFVCRKE